VVSAFQYRTEPPSERQVVAVRDFVTDSTLYEAGAIFDRDEAIVLERPEWFRPLLESA
jgi:hypothetical protein